MHENKEVRKLELCDIAPYLPFGLRTDKGLLHALCNDGLAKCRLNDGEIVKGKISWLKPLLRPLTTLTQEITHNGVTFIPIVELFNLQGEEYYIVDNMAGNKNILVDIDRGEYGVERHTVASFSTKHIHLYSYKQVMRLVSWHFDISDLISTGLAIPIHNTK